MRAVAKAELNQILAAHKEWVEGGYSKGARANLRYADLSSANLSYADLSSANLSYADLSSANLSSADLRSADLSSANLRSADLRSADLSSANLRSADLRSAKNFDPDEHRDVFWIIPEIGAFVGWKKLRDEVIAKLEIPAKAKRTCSLKGRKCRAEYVKTLDLYKDGKAWKGVGIGSHDGATEYRIGRITRPDSYNDSRFEDCTNGIHFFICKSEAEAY